MGAEERSSDRISGRGRAGGEELWDTAACGGLLGVALAEMEFELDSYAGAGWWPRLDVAAMVELHQATEWKCGVMATWRGLAPLGPATRPLHDHSCDYEPSSAPSTRCCQRWLDGNPG